MLGFWSFQRKSQHENPRAHKKRCGYRRLQYSDPISFHPDPRMFWFVLEKEYFDRFVLNMRMLLETGDAETSPEYISELVNPP